MARKKQTRRAAARDARGSDLRTPADLAPFEGSALHKLGLVIIGLKVLIATIALDPSAYVVFSQPKALFGHALGLVLGGVLATLVLRNGPAILRLSVLHIGVAAVLVANMIATVFALDRHIALFGVLDRQLGLITLLDNVVLYFAIVTLVRRPRDLLIPGIALSTAALLLLAYALVQRLGLDPLTWRSGIATERPFAMLGNPGSLGQFFGTLTAAAVGALVTIGHSAPHPWRAILVASCVVTLSGAALTGTRAVGIGLASAAVVVAVWLIASRAPARWRAYSAAGLIAVLALALGLGAREILGTGVGLASGRLTAADGSIAGRLDLYRIGLSEISARPLVGVGPDNYVVAYPSHRTADMTRFHESDAPQTSPHSWPLKVATDSGALGLVAYIALFALAGRAAWSGGPAGLIGVAAITSFLGTGSISIGDIGTEWMLWAGLAVIGLSTRFKPGSAGVDDGARRSQHFKRTRAAGRWTWLPVALAVAVGVFQLNALEGSRAAADSRAARQTTPARDDVAVARGQTAVELDPGRAEYWHELGLSLASGGQFREAERAFERAVLAAPHQAVYWTNLAKAQVAIGQGSDGPELKEALGTARRAVAADPHIGGPYSTLALALLANDDPAAAAAAAERSLELAPVATDRTIYEVAARAYVENAQPVEAERWIRLGLPRTSGRDNVDLRFLLVRILIQHDRTDEAREHLRLILEFDPADNEARRVLQQLAAE